MPQTLIFEDHYKKLGLEFFSGEHPGMINSNKFRHDVKIFFIPAGYELTVDFNRFKTIKPSLFFLSTQQVNIEHGKDGAILLYYNRDFYCIQIHDKEVACDGLLFHNVFEIPFIELDREEAAVVKKLFSEIQYELEWKDSSAEEMIRTYVKQLIIRSTRMWKKQHLDQAIVKISGHELDIFRDFSRFLEIHFREKHHVSDYADLLHMAPKTLTHKFRALRLESPNQLIINRILLEAKRLLLYTDKPVKEIAHHLGYEDPAYFNRLFTQKTENTPSNFRKNYLSGKKYNT
ncbi:MULTISPECIES: helix-turn-helix domain-containing protein [Chryseobacterium]|uniref:AraC family 4-hydroxyphenylacetate 3-monooxygenase operon regulatory protein n=1 Tax=Chryseobacterium camelliae TaxID=1265445 RepID=A0ABU0TN12_9FLAO|nr:MULTISPECIES: AraC family transcriptional regulator [Chryseobacterium]MDT3407705.1 AraC family 4-hydroxyphenylacetate 3-monooxygenase operon regulatory protein [Pseudacidovorax intermedius]MDQ1098443.1 AraC family 4-hydroxyphenylacetate 3-monooxygenase operon regulatory protein [Chryseobacterium camelliae]MDQ1102367.1 AraC family 4-hydroxyphenylacetate 3-monooxygenase operon regulatory protein [Chryseobacterium sp. SORGH_AS_1048]MDR6085804.1 AraC family 4-hydroxyphenylacetate 3-monooxygenase